MPNYGPRVPHNLVSIDANDRVALTTDDWRGLEGHLGRPVDEEARAALLALCNEHLKRRKFEVEAISLRQVHDVLSKLARAAGAADMATEDANFRLYRHLANTKIIVDLAPSPEQVSGDWDEPTEPTLVALSRDTALSIIAHLNIAAGKAMRELEQELSPTADRRVAFEPGTSLRSLLLGVIAWAKEHGLPYSTNNRGGKAQPISNFLFVLHQHFPVQGQERRPASALSLQKRINDALREDRA